MRILGLDRLESRIVPSGGKWVALTTQAPTTDGNGGIQNMLLLPNGVVLAHGGVDSTSQLWFDLSPDLSGNYVDGEWNQTPSVMNESRLFATTVVLPNQDVFTVGGEYSSPDPFTNTAEIFNPTQTIQMDGNIALQPGKWTSVAPAPTPPTQVDLFGQNITGASDTSPIVITSNNQLPDGEQVTVSGVEGNTAANGTFTIANDNGASFALVGSHGNGAYDTTMITGATNTSPIVITASNTSFLSNDQLVYISGVNGNPNANGAYFITNLNHTSNTFQLYGSNGNGAYTGGGLVSEGQWNAPAASQFGDDPIEVLPNGDILAGYFGGPGTYIYNPNTNQWFDGPVKLYGNLTTSSDEETWEKLPDGSILDYDIGASENSTPPTFYAQRYIPSADPLATTNITGATNASPIVITASNTSFLSNGEAVTITGVNGNTNADGTYIIAGLTSNSFQLVGTKGNGAYTGGGVATGGAGEWIDASAVNKNSPPSILSINAGSELGPAFFLPDGRVFQIGEDGTTAFYTPPPQGSLGEGVWSAGPPIPYDLSANDATGAMMPNGDVLFIATGTKPGQTNPGEYVFEFTPNDNDWTAPSQITEVDPPSQYTLAGVLYPYMLDLPNGQILMSDNTNQLLLWEPYGSPNGSWAPTVTDIVQTGNGVVTLTGARINGISEGANFGDDIEMATNYPIVQLHDLPFIGDPYLSTYNWSYTGISSPGDSTPHSVSFGLANGEDYLLTVSANGISSSPVLNIELSAGYNDITLESDPTVPGHLDILSNGQFYDSWPFADFSSIIVSGAESTTNTVRVDYDNGFFNTPVTFDGGILSTNSLLVDDDSDASGQVWGVTDNELSANGASVFYNLVQTVTLQSGYGGGITQVTSTSLYTTLNIISSGSEAVIVGSGGILGTQDSNLLEINGNINIDNPFGLTTLYVDDADDNSGGTAILNTVTMNSQSWGSISGLSIGVIDYDYSDVSNFTLQTINAVNVQATGVLPALGVITLEQLSPNADVYVGNNNSLSGIQGPLTITDSDFTNVYIDDSTDTAPHPDVTLNATSLSGLAPATITFGADDLASLMINGGSGGTVYTIAATQASGVSGGTLTTLNTDNNDDEVNVQGTDGAGLTLTGEGFYYAANIGLNNSLSGITAPLNLEGPSSYIVNINDSADDKNHSNIVLSGNPATGGSLTGLAPVPIHFGVDGFKLTVNLGNGRETFTKSDSEGLFYQGETFNGGSGGDTWNIQQTSSGATNINSNGRDTIVVGDANGVQDIQGNLTVSSSIPSSDTLTLNDQSQSHGGNVIITSTYVTGQLAPALISFGASALSALNINAGSNDNFFTIDSSPSNTTVSLSALGTDNGIEGPLSSVTWLFQVVGGQPQYALLQPNQAAPIYFKGVQSVNGESDNDYFEFLGTGFNGSINGGPGNNTLDFSQFSSPVTVTYTGPGSIVGEQGTATGITGGFDNINLVIGTSVLNAAVTSPMNGSSISNNVPTLTATAGDVGGPGLAGVIFQIFNGENSWNNLDTAETSGPFSYTFPSPLADGTYKVRAYVYDVDNNFTTSAPVSFTIDTAPPTVSMTAPAAGSNSTNTEPTLAATAAGIGLSSVQFQFSSDNGVIWNAVGALETSEPFSYTFTTALQPGTYEARAIATDDVYMSTTSAPVTFTISSPLLAVAMTAPDNSSVTSNGIVTLTATASDVGGPGVYGVQFESSPNGGNTWGNIGEPVTSAPYSYTYPNALANSTYLVRAVAIDDDNGTAASAPISFTVNTQAFTAVMTAPANGSTTHDNTPTLSAFVSNLGGNGNWVYGVQFESSPDDGNTWNDIGSPIYGSGEDPSESFSYTFPSFLADGTYEVRAEGINDGNATVNSPPIFFTINTAPQPLSITTATVENWTVDQPGYSQTISAYGGIAPYSFAVTAGGLPKGLTLSSGSDIINGIPTQSGKFSFTVTASDSTPSSVSQTYSLTINKPLAFTDTALDSWTVNQPNYDQSIPATGGTAPVSFSVSSATGWSEASSLPSARSDLGAAISSNGLIYAIGGITSVGAVSQEVDAYNPLTNTWSIKAPLPDPRSDFGIAAGLNGTIYVIGGLTDTGYTSEVDAYDPMTNTWSLESPLPDARSALASTTGLNGTIYAIGGLDAPGSESSEVDAFNPATNTWTAIASLVYGDGFDYLAAVTGSNDTIYAIGGNTQSGNYDNGISDWVQSLNQSTGQWTVSNYLPVARSNLAAATGLDGTMYYIGGFDGSNDSSEVDAYNPQTVNYPMEIANLPVARDNLAAAGLNGIIYAIGGATPTGTTSEVDAYFASALPSGLSLNLTTGAITGTPTTAGTFNFTVTAVDSTGATATHTFTITINAPLTITTTTISNPIEGEPFSQTIATSGGTAPVGFSIADTWNQIPTLPDYRTGVAAAADTGGDIYAIGGSTYAGPSSEVDVFDPSSTTNFGWTPVASLPTPREDFAATAGTNGIVYALGGINSSSYPGYLGTPEVDGYDPSTNTWTVEASLPDARFELAAAAGLDGTIYAIGGSSFASANAGSEVDAYNPNLNTWTTVASLPDARSGLAAATGLDGTIYAIGGEGNSGVSNEVDAYDPTTNTWTVISSLPIGIYDAAATPGTNGNIYVIGGTDESGNASSAVYEYNIKTGLWSSIASIPNGGGQNVSAAATGLDGTIYAIGYDNYALTNGATIWLPNVPNLPSGLTLNSSTGVISGTMTQTGTFAFAVMATDASGATAIQSYSITVSAPLIITTTTLSSWPVYQPGFDQTIQTTGGLPPVTFSLGGWDLDSSNLPDQREGLAAATGLDGTIYAIGGYDPSGGPVSEVDAYNTAANIWTPIASLPTPRGDIAATTGLDGNIYAIGGYNDGGTSEVDGYNPSTNTWSYLPGLPDQRFGIAAATGLDGTIYAIGGYGPNGLSDEVDAYDPSTYTWTILAPLPDARGYLAAATGLDGTIYAIGGIGTSGVSSEVDAYDPYTNTWTVIASLPNGRSGLGAATGLDGTIYAIGGMGAGSDSYSDEVDAYNPATGVWTTLANLPAARSGLAVTAGLDGTIYAIGGSSSASYTNEVDTYSGAAVPSGLSFNTSTGEITGTPTTAGNFPLTVVATDSAGDTASQSYTIDITGSQTQTQTYINTITPEPSVAGQTVTMTATVEGDNPTGAVTFLDDGIVLGDAPLFSGNATFTTSSLAVGTQYITASYSGDSNSSSSTSYAVEQDVDQCGTSATVSSSSNPSVYGTILAFTATITADVSGTLAPTGSFTFYDGSTPLATEQLSGNTAEFFTLSLSVGTHSITAVYSGDSNFLPTTSPAVDQVVTSTAGAPAVESVVVNGNQVQHSMVTSIQVIFSAQVETALLQSAFKLTRVGLPNGVPGDNATVGNISVSVKDQGDPDDPGSTLDAIATLTFSGANTEEGSLADGDWMLSIDHTKVVYAGVEMASDYQQSGITRLFGDFDGSGTVDSSDLGLFGTTFGLTSTSPAFLSMCDSDGNGIIDSTDLGRFGSNFGLTI